MRIPFLTLTIFLTNVMCVFLSAVDLGIADADPTIARDLRIKQLADETDLYAH